MPLEVVEQFAQNGLQGQRAPLLVFLHGSGERDRLGPNVTAVTQVKQHGPWVGPVGVRPQGGYHADAIAEINRFHVVGFHLPGPDDDWIGTKLMPNLLSDLNVQLNTYIRESLRIDGERVYLTGLSLGGRGVLELAIHRRTRRPPEPVSALAVFCPAPHNYLNIGALRDIPIYFFHCPEDGTVLFEPTAALHKLVGSRRSRLRIVHVSELVDPAHPHVCWTHVYGHPEFYQWLLMVNPGTDPAAWPHMKLPYP